jgi:hypothetical protein
MKQVKINKIDLTGEIVVMRLNTIAKNNKLDCGFTWNDGKRGAYGLLSAINETLRIYKSEYDEDEIYLRNTWIGHA